MIYILAAILTAWIGAGVAATGWAFAYFQRNWPALRAESFRRDRWEYTLVCIAGGPLALGPSYGLRRHGWLWPWSKRAKQEAFPEAL